MNTKWQSSLAIAQYQATSQLTNCDTLSNDSTKIPTVADMAIFSAENRVKVWVEFSDSLEISKVYGQSPSVLIDLVRPNISFVFVGKNDDLALVRTLFSEEVTGGGLNDFGSSRGSVVKVVSENSKSYLLSLKDILNLPLTIGIGEFAGFDQAKHLLLLPPR